MALLEDPQKTDAINHMDAMPGHVGHRYAFGGAPVAAAAIGAVKSISTDNEGYDWHIREPQDIVPIQVGGSVVDISGLVLTAGDRRCQP